MKGRRVLHIASAPTPGVDLRKGPDIRMRILAEDTFKMTADCLIIDVWPMQLVSSPLVSGNENERHIEAPATGNSDKIAAQ